MKLIVGLGNPENQYDGTRHNIGFMCINEYAKYNNAEFKEKFNGYSAEFIHNGEKVILLKPDTYMNNSGQAVRKYMDFYKVDLEDVMIVYDDLDMDFGKIRIKKKSSSGGHNGVKSIISHVNTDDFIKVKIGIKNEFKKDVKNFVLSKFNKNEVSDLSQVYRQVDEIIDTFIVGNDAVFLMNKFN
jgi:PTH1 family peptidyl-tRNA hydrolase